MQANGVDLAQLDLFAVPRADAAAGTRPASGCAARVSLSGFAGVGDEWGEPLTKLRAVLPAQPRATPSVMDRPEREDCKCRNSSEMIKKSGGPPSAEDTSHLVRVIRDTLTSVLSVRLLHARRSVARERGRRLPAEVSMRRSQW